MERKPLVMYSSLTEKRKLFHDSLLVRRSSRMTDICTLFIKLKKQKAHCTNVEELEPIPKPYLTLRVRMKNVINYR